MPWAVFDSFWVSRFVFLMRDHEIAEKIQEMKTRHSALRSGVLASLCPRVAGVRAGTERWGGLLAPYL